MFAMDEKPAHGIREQALLDPATLRVLSDPQRSFIVYSVTPRAKTVKELAAELGCPPTRLYYHVQQLEKHGLVFVEETRLVSGIVEKHYRAVARELLLDRAAFQVPGGTDAARVDALLGFVFDQSRREVQRQVETGAIDLALRAPAAGSLVAWRNVLKLDRAQAASLYARLTALWQEYDALAKQPAEGGDFYAFAVALYPNGVAQSAVIQPSEGDAP